MEIWKDIEGYEGLYQVSNMGRVKRLVYTNQGGSFHRERIKTAIIKPNGYLYVTLSKDHKEKNFYVHRLVAKAFIPNDNPKKDVVNHIDYNRSNNCVSNLEWCTQMENTLYSRERMLHGIKKRPKPLTNTGEKHIIYRKNKDYYRVIINRKEKHAKTLEEAIKIRDRWLNETI